MPRPAVTMPRVAMLAFALGACRYPDCSSEANSAATEIATSSMILAAVFIVASIIVLSLRHRIASIIVGALGITAGTTFFGSSSCASILARSSSANTHASLAMFESLVCLGLDIFALVRGVKAIDEKPPRPHESDVYTAGDEDRR